MKIKIKEEWLKKKEIKVKYQKFNLTEIKCDRACDQGSITVAACADQITDYDTGYYAKTD